MSLVVFDLDGTLIDSRQDLADAANALIVERGGAPLAVETITGMVGEGAALLVRRALTAAGLEPELETALPRFLQLYDERLLAHTRLYPGTLEALDALARQFTLAVLTNKPQRPTETILRGLNVLAYFAHVVGGDTAFGRKPEPAGLRHLMTAAGASRGATVLVGDSAIDLRTARAAGVRVCLVKYGFGFPLAAAELSGDEQLADSPAHLETMLLSRFRGGAA
ncbi:MAG TPA: HAD-IA family hydrolase [Vicinamibacterales bacterium]|nr:HAD-IA family hydrolase [Vicinamibacterales bacterium]